MRASELTATWAASYVSWLHYNPFAHDQNAFDAFLGHFIQEPWLYPDNLGLSVPAARPTSKGRAPVGGTQGVTGNLLTALRVNPDPKPHQVLGASEVTFCMLSTPEACQAPG